MVGRINNGYYIKIFSNKFIELYKEKYLTTFIKYQIENIVYNYNDYIPLYKYTIYKT